MNALPIIILICKHSIDEFLCPIKNIWHFPLMMSFVTILIEFCCRDTINHQLILANFAAIVVHFLNGGLSTGQVAEYLAIDSHSLFKIWIDNLAPLTPYVLLIVSGPNFSIDILILDDSARCKYWAEFNVIVYDIQCLWQMKCLDDLVPTMQQPERATLVLDMNLRCNSRCAVNLLRDVNDIFRTIELQRLLKLRAVIME